MLIPLITIVTSLLLLVYSADKFVSGASALALRAGISPLVVGMVIIGFGTSAPELMVSAMAAVGGNAELALGNAFGSNISNIGLILGLTALLSPIAFQSRILRRELPLLTLVSLGVWVLLLNGMISRLDAVLMLTGFALVMLWTLRQQPGRQDQAFISEIDSTAQPVHSRPLWRDWLELLLGLILLIICSRLLVNAAVDLAQAFGVSDLVIGLTIVAVGTSLPELASSLAAIRRREHDLALGNVLGSNLFNTLAVVGLAGVIQPFAVMQDVLSRDLPVMLGFTLVLFAVGYGWRRPGRINRLEGGLMLLGYIAYLIWLVAVASAPA